VPLIFLLDEHLRGVARRAVRHHNAKSAYVIDAVWVGGPPDLPQGSLDPELLKWADTAGRILISHDRKSMPGHFQQHMMAGRHSPGVLLIRPGTTVAALVAELALIAHAGNPADYFDQIDFIP
jgi:hypothetical protein